MKKNKTIPSERDPLPTCASCEYAGESDHDGMFLYCTRSDSEVSVNSLCTAYVYDLLKRQPLRLRLTAHLTPNLLDD